MNGRKLPSGWHGKDPAPHDMLGRLVTEVGTPLPNTYLQFLALSNGGEGFVGDDYLSLWAADEVVQLNQDYEIQTWLPEALAFATDGGGKAYVFDLRTESRAILRVPLGDLDFESARLIAPSFEAWLFR